MAEKSKHSFDKVKTLELLAEELIKKTPSENNIKSYMEVTGLQYHEDPIERINIVLKALQAQAEE